MIYKADVRNKITKEESNSMFDDVCGLVVTNKSYTIQEVLDAIPMVHHNEDMELIPYENPRIFTTWNNTVFSPSQIIF